MIINFMENLIKKVKIKMINSEKSLKGNIILNILNMIVICIDIIIIIKIQQ